MIYKMTVSSHITIYEEREFFVKADSAAEAKIAAEKEFANEVENAYGWVDYDEINTMIEGKYEND